MITEPDIVPPTVPFLQQKRIRRRLLFCLAGIVMLTGCLIAYLNHLKAKASYQYAHVPFQSSLVPRPYPQAGQSVAGIAFSPHGRLLAVADMQEGMSYWSIPSLRCDRRLDAPRGGGTATVMRWTPDGYRILIGDSESIRQIYYDGNAFRLVRSVKQVSHVRRDSFGDGYRYRAVSTSGLLAADANAEGDVAAWNIQTGQLLFSVSALPPGKFGYPTSFCDFAFSSDDRLVATTSMQEGDTGGYAPVDVLIRDTQTGHILRQWQWKQAKLVRSGASNIDNLSTTGLTFSSDGALLAMADDYQVSVWNARDGTLEKTLAIPDLYSEYPGKKRLVFFDGGRLLVGIGWGTAIPVWDVRTGALLQTFYGQTYMEALAVSPDGRWLATGEGDKHADGRLELWDVSRLLR